MLNYTAVDFETANSYRGSPCAVGMVRVRDGVAADQRRWLMRPPEVADFFDPFNVWVHGITADMVAGAPRWKDVIRYACAADNIEWPAIRFLCTLVLARHALSLPSYRLPFVVEAVGRTFDEHHDPLVDARAVVDVVDGLAAMNGATDLDSLASAVGVCIGRMSSGLYTGSVSLSGGRKLARPEINPDADPNGYLYGRVVVFTGALMSMTRQIAWEECSRIGAPAERGVTKRTNVLVIGDINPAVLCPGATLTERAAHAFALQDKGQDIEVMTEDDFLRCVDGKPLASLTDLLSGR